MDDGTEVFESALREDDLFSVPGQEGLDATGETSPAAQAELSPIPYSVGGVPASMLLAGTGSPDAPPVAVGRGRRAGAGRGTTAPRRTQASIFQDEIKFMFQAIQDGQQELQNRVMQLEGAGRVHHCSLLPALDPIPVEDLGDTCSPPAFQPNLPTFGGHQMCLLFPLRV